jgi:hypothetical protein
MKNDKILTRKLVYLEWQWRPYDLLPTSEIDPHGFSLHLTEEYREKFTREFWQELYKRSGMDGLPTYPFSQPTGVITMVGVTENLYCHFVELSSSEKKIMGLRMLGNYLPIYKSGRIAVLGTKEDEKNYQKIGYSDRDIDLVLKHLERNKS